MAVKCSHCGKIYDVSLFRGDEAMVCGCGAKLTIFGMENVADFLRFCESEEERARAEEIRQDAENICRMILDEKCPEVDIGIAEEKLRRKVEELFPGKMETYRMIYESRFMRLREQFRRGPEGG